MFCSQCGRKLREGMLFCPFCGAEIVIPDQDEPRVDIPAAESAPTNDVTVYFDRENPADAAPSLESRATRRRARVADAAETLPASDPPSSGGAGETVACMDEPRPDGTVELGAGASIADAPEAPAAASGKAEPSPDAIDWRSAFDDWLSEASEAPASDETRKIGEPAGGSETVALRQPDNGDNGRVRLSGDDNATVAVRPSGDENATVAVRPSGDDSATVWVDQPDRPRHRPAEGEAVPVRRRSEPEGRARRGRAGRRARQDAARETTLPRRPGKASLSGGASRGTVVPRRRQPSEDLFLDTTVPAAVEDRAAYADRRTVEVEEERPGFFIRHLRSMVGLILLAVLAFIIGVYAVSEQGQTNLAKLNLAWRPEVYSQLGKESYNVGRFQQAGAYYEQALRREPDNYSYASSAAKCYLDGKDRDRATEMLKKCIELMPTAEDPYIYLLGLYPDPVERPLEITQLLEQGYQMTGSERLKEAVESGN